MAKLCGASLLVLLVAVVHSGSALHCYESMCLNDASINTCILNNRTILKECNSAILRQNLLKLQGAGGTVPQVPSTAITWTCIKHELSGVQAGIPAKVDLRMCFPDGTNACDQFANAAKGLEFPLGGQQVTRQCNACTADSCNPAHRPTASILVPLVAAAMSLLLLRH